MPAIPHRHSASLSRVALAAALGLLASASPLALRHDAHHGIALRAVTAQAAESFAIDKVEVDTKAGKLALQDIRVTGSSLSRSEVEALFKVANVKELAERLAKFDAESIVIGSMRWQQDNEAVKGDTIYEKIQASGIKAGAIARIEFGGAKATSTARAGKQKDIETKMTMGRMTLDALDLTAMARWIVDSDPTGAAPMKLIHGTYVIDSMEMSSPVFTARINKVTLSGFKARLPRKPIVDMVGTLSEMQKSDGSPKPELSIGTLTDLLDVWTSFEMGDGRIEGMAIGGKDDKGTAFAATVGPIRFSGGANAGGTSDGIDIRAADGFFKIGGSRFEGDGYGLVFAGLASAALNGEQGKSAKPEERAKLEAVMKGMKLRDLLFAFSNVDADLPDSKAKAERVRFQIAGFETRVGSYVGAIPTTSSVKLTSFKMPVPANSKDEGLKTLRELGLDTLDLSFGIDARWDEPKKTFSLADASVSVLKLAKVGLKGELGNIDKSLFDDPMSNWPLAMTSGTVRNLSISIENAGGLDKLIAKTAKDQKKTPEQLRVEIQTMGPAIIGAFMANHPDAAKLAEALTTFLKTLGSLSLTARAANGDGLNFTDFASASGNPAALLSKLRFDVSAK